MGAWEWFPSQLQKEAELAKGRGGRRGQCRVSPRVVRAAGWVLGAGV